MKKFKVKDRVRAIKDHYGCTTLKNEWEGVVTKVYENGEFDAMTIKSKDQDDFFKSVVYEGLKPDHFELIAKRPTKKQLIAKLEKKISELQIEVAALKEAMATQKFAPVTASNIEIGDKIRVIYASGIGPAVLTTGKVYEVESRATCGDFYVTDDEGDLMSIVESEFHAVEKLVSE